MLKLLRVSGTGFNTSVQMLLWMQFRYQGQNYELFEEELVLALCSVINNCWCSEVQSENMVRALTSEVTRASEWRSR
jgi:hypothetical protein